MRKIREWYRSNVEWRYLSPAAAMRALRQAKRRLKGETECHRCGGPKPHDRYKNCAPCRKYGREWQREADRKKREKALAEGRCTKCLKPNEDAGTFKLCRGCRFAAQDAKLRAGRMRAAA